LLSRTRNIWIAATSRSGITLSVIAKMTIDKNCDQNSKRECSNVVFVLGPPGSGKGTQCQKIEQTFGYVHLSAGDLLRSERERKGSQFGELIERHICEGTIVPVEITCKLLENAMAECADSQGFLIDGFPRNQDNLDGWQRAMASKTTVRFVLFLEAPVDVCTARCLSRNKGRSDDNEESMRKRIVTYNEQTMPVIQHYVSLGLVKEVDSSKSTDEVFENIKAIFEAN